MNLVLYTALVSLLLSGCTSLHLEKRRYTKGFHLSYSKNKQFVHPTNSNVEKKTSTKSEHQANINRNREAERHPVDNQKQPETDSILLEKTPVAPSQPEGDVTLHTLKTVSQNKKSTAPNSVKNNPDDEKKEYKNGFFKRFFMSFMITLITLVVMYGFFAGGVFIVQMAGIWWSIPVLVFCYFLTMLYIYFIFDINKRKDTKDMKLSRLLLLSFIGPALVAGLLFLIFI